MRSAEGAADRLQHAVDDVVREHPGLRTVKRVVVAVVGGTMLLLGVVLLVAPGPAFLVIPAGLAILALEFRWARRWLRKVKAMITRKKDGAEGKENDENQK